jgi:hypothetical protein
VYRLVAIANSQRCAENFVEEPIYGILQYCRTRGGGGGGVEEGDGRGTGGTGGDG